MAYNPKDFYFKKAKERHFAARSVFKLEELHQRFKLFRPGQRVLDLGCAPGSWSQFISKEIGKSGVCLGIDLARVNFTLPNCFFYQGDAFSEELLQSLLAQHQIPHFDIIVSDMAPKTSGIRIQDQVRSYELCKLALSVAQIHLRKSGAFVVKLFQSEFFDSYLKDMRTQFKKVELFRPKSTRKASYEIYVIGLQKLG